MDVIGGGSRQRVRVEGYLCKFLVDLEVAKPFANRLR